MILCKRLTRTIYFCTRFAVSVANAACESLFASLKREAFPAGCVFDSKREARRTIFQYIEIFYNQERIHTALGNQSPEKFLTNHFPPETITLN